MDDTVVAILLEVRRREMLELSLQRGLVSYVIDNVCQQVAQLWRRDRATHAPYSRVGHFEANFRLKGYVLRIWTVRWGKWLYYNLAAGSFHTKKFAADFVRLKLNEFYSERQKIAS